MRNSTLLCRRDFWGSPYRLDILTKIFRIIFKYIFFSVSSVCSVDYSVATLEILEEILILKNGRGPEIIQ